MNVELTVFIHGFIYRENSYLLYLWPIKAAETNPKPFKCALLPRL